MYPDTFSFTCATAEKVRNKPSDKIEIFFTIKFLLLFYAAKVEFAFNGDLKIM
ncbi:hypothetical protein FACS1894160_1700 [Bacteroidia bacterium]|nr:hypothetical protein FACS1894123_07380 [Bacteroidia bacterium]GHV08057.1 hypothetical protein FACS1894160_1700 [Bacteroidia bacterium]